jgi:hypothetical protein
LKLGHESSATSIKSSKPTWIDFASDRGVASLRV